MVARRQAALAALIVAVAFAGCGRAGGGAVRSARNAAASAATSVAPPSAAHVFELGRSVRGRAIRARVVGDPLAPRRILIVGCVHGDESAGEAITRRLRRAVPPAGVALWLVDEFNPDGCRAHTRQNARGVDLNRNSPWHWRPLQRPGETYYSGRGPLSEPESQAINRFARRLHPALSIWYHQHAALVDASGGDASIERRYARLVHLPFRSYGTFPGSITSWQNAAFRSDTAFVVELAAGALSQASVTRHAGAVLALSSGAAPG